MNQPQPARNSRILVVDDNRAIHEDFRKILQGAKNGPLDEMEAALFDQPSQSRSRIHFQIDSAYQGQEGLALVQQTVKEGRPYALAFVDVRMPPGWDGIETTARIWEVDPDVQVVICTAYSDYSWDAMREKLGNSSRLLILKKPFDTIEALQLASALTEKWSLTQHKRKQMEYLEITVQERTHELRTANERLRREMAEREEAEHQIREQAALLDHAQNAILVRGPDERIRYWNKGAERLYGWSAAEAVGQNADELFHTENPLPLHEAPNHAAHQDQWIGELHQRTREGKPIIVESRLTPLRDGSGELKAELIINADITERKQLEEQLRQSQKMEAIGQLSGGVAHDFNNLLTVINGYTQLLLGHPGLERDMVEPLEQIFASADRAANLTRQLLTFSRRQVIQRRALNLSEVATNITRMLWRILGEDIALNVNCPSNLPPIHADPGMMEQILLNLAVNSRDAMPRGGQVFVTTGAVNIDEAYVRENLDAKVGRAVFLSVRDTGSGIPPEALPRIFEPFFTTKGVGEGTGLGLATVYGIVQQHQGWVKVQSEVGKGTTFQIFFPVSQDQVTDRDNTLVDAPVRGGSETVLVVEDETALRALVTRVLRRHGYEVLEASSGVVALDIWNRHKDEIDLVLTDMVMPEGITGRELAERLRAEKPGLKVVFTTGYSVEIIGRDLVLSEGTNLLQKPYPPRKLAQTIRDCLDAKRLSV